MIAIVLWFAVLVHLTNHSPQILEYCSIIWGDGPGRTGRPFRILSQLFCFGVKDVCVCVYLCVCMCVYVYMCGCGICSYGYAYMGIQGSHVYICMWRPEVAVRDHL